MCLVAVDDTGIEIVEKRSENTLVVYESGGDICFSIQTEESKIFDFRTTPQMFERIIKWYQEERVVRE